mgnify:CR=1 FL=1
MAEEADVDLVEIAPKAVPPVCRLMDYGKFRYQEQKKAQEAKAKQKVVQVKEVKFRPATDENDFQTKLRSLIRFLNDGDKAKVTLRFRGREMAHTEIGENLLKRFAEECADVA